MSKSTGNFMTLYEALDTFGADAMRFCLADSGDSVEDANFVSANADAAILRLYAFIEWSAMVVKDSAKYRSGKLTFQDEYFEKYGLFVLTLGENVFKIYIVFIIFFLFSLMQKQIKETEDNFDKMLFKEALKSGFFEMQIARDKYRELVGGEENMHKDLILKFIEFQTQTLSPVCPHVAEHVWTNVLQLVSILQSHISLLINANLLIIYYTNCLGHICHNLKVACC